MVLESLINPFKAKKKPWEMFFIGFLFASVAILLSNWVFKEQASLLMVFLTVLAAVPLLYSTMKMEEEEGANIQADEKEILIKHSKTIKFLMYMFFGFVVAFVFWYIALPAGTIKSLYHVQTVTIQSINARAISGFSVKLSSFGSIFFNNVKVLIFCILFSFLYGAGAIFILTWNASVIATAIGNFVRTNISSYASAAGFQKLGAYFHIITIGLLKYSIHGIPEIIAYFVAGLAGGIISVAVIRENFGTKSFSKALVDSSDLIIIAFLLILIAALLEVFITPFIF